MDLQLNHKTALVTGRSKGIGEAIALALAREGATVVIHGRDQEQAQRVVNAIAASGGRAHAVLGDLTNDDAVERLVAEAREAVGAIDILVNNAGGSGPKSDWESTTSAGWGSTYDRNVLAAVRVSTRILPFMRQARWGRVINIYSGAATMPPRDRAGLFRRKGRDKRPDRLDGEGGGRRGRYGQRDLTRNDQERQTGEWIPGCSSGARDRG